MIDKLVSELQIDDILQTENGSVKVTSVREFPIIESVSGKCMEILTSDGGTHLLSSGDRVELAS